MSNTQLHLLVNHFPLIGTCIAIIILIIGMISHQKQIKMIALGLFIFNALMCVPSMITGEKSEHAVEEQPGVARFMIEEHEEIAEQSTWVMDGLAVLALITIFLYYKNHPASKWLLRLCLILSLISIYFAVQVGHSGGQIRRPDLRIDETKSE